MIISLIGMSGSGKSHWSKLLANEGFARLCADDIIEQKLGAELTQHGYKGIGDVSKWMGQPYDERYVWNSNRYLELEGETMQEFMVDVATRAPGDDVVVDTTGSLIYLSPEILRELAKLSTIVYFHTPESAQARMVKLYLEDPKPILWGGSYNRLANESPLQSITRCYPLFLQDRTIKYQKLANVTFDYYELRNISMTPKKIIEAAKVVHV